MKKKVLSVLLVAAMAMSMLTGWGRQAAGGAERSIQRGIQGNRGSSRNTCFRRRRDTDCMVLGP